MEKISSISIKCDALSDDEIDILLTFAKAMLFDSTYKNSIKRLSTDIKEESQTVTFSEREH